METSKSTKSRDGILWILCLIGGVLVLSGILGYELGRYFYNFFASAYDDGELAKDAIHIQVCFAIFNASYYVFPGLLFITGISCWAISIYVWVFEKCIELIIKTITKFRGKYEA